MALCIHCVADPSFLALKKITPPAETGYCSYCGSEDVQLVRLDGIADPARRSRLTWARWAAAAKRDSAEVAEYAEMFYDLAADLKLLSARVSAGTLLFRARLGASRLPDGRVRPYEGEEIGAPPEGRRKVGRVNPEGKCVLYCADQEATAVAEVRPARGQFVSVAHAELVEDVLILDLTATPDRGPLPPGQAYPWLEILGFLRAFDAELATPLERDDDPAEYLPCQRFAQSVESQGLEGLRYRSAMNPGGSNAVLFDPAAAKVFDSKLVQITATRVEYEARSKDLFLPKIAE